MKHLLLIFLLLIVFPIQARAQDHETCPDNLPSRLTVGEAARVTPGDANNVRASASGGAELIGQIPGSSVFTVLDGPVCADGFTWWQVQYADIEGWTVEGSDDYWLEPLPGMQVYEDEFIRFAYFAESMGEISTDFYEADDRTSIMGGPKPEQRFYTIEDWATDKDWQEGRIHIVPVNQITEDTWRFHRALTGIQDLLATEPDIVLEAPTLVSNAGQVGVVKPSFTNFANGRGLVFATEYVQDFAPFIPSEYEFIGLTHDGGYLLNVRLGITTAETNVPFDRSDYLGVSDEIQDNYHAYGQQVAEALADRPDDEFTPNLADLRLMIETIEVLGS